MKLHNVVPWGRSFQEYQRMFLLSEADLKTSILACADGPASFNVEARQKGINVTSVDPLYQFSADAIDARIDTIADEVISQVEQHKESFVWQFFSNPQELYEKRMYAMKLFLTDYAQQTNTAFYINAQLPDLPFENKQFDLALCSHFLFLYSDHFDAQFHLKSMVELCRVARQVRVYPLIGLDNTPSPHLGLIIEKLTQQGHTVEQYPVDYHFQQGATHMLVVSTAP